MNIDYAIGSVHGTRYTKKNWKTWHHSPGT